MGCCQDRKNKLSDTERHYRSEAVALPLTAVLPLLRRRHYRLRRPPQKAPALPLRGRPSTAAVAALPPGRKRHYRSQETSQKSPKPNRRKVRETAALPLGERYYCPSGTTAVQQA